MKERPILMSAPMIRAILDGRKTQTRRWLHASPGDEAILDQYGAGWRSVFSAQGDGHGGVFRQVNGGTLSVPLRSPYGSPEERLWVRETWQTTTTPADRDTSKLVFAADHAGGRPGFAEDDWSWRPSIFMPRWASRITLEVTEVRVQRLQEITAADACDEGALDVLDVGHPLHRECYEKRGTWTGNDRLDRDGPYAGAVDAFATLWDSINGKRAPWSSNPWVWAISFRRVS